MTCRQWHDRLIQDAWFRTSDRFTAFAAKMQWCCCFYPKMTSWFTRTLAPFKSPEKKKDWWEVMGTLQGRIIFNQRFNNVAFFTWQMMTEYVSSAVLFSGLKRTGVIRRGVLYWSPNSFWVGTIAACICPVTTTPVEAEIRCDFLSAGGPAI